MFEQNVMSYEPTLPENFDGTFKFSNPSDEDFVGIWNKKEYLFPAKSTVPLVIPEHSPLEIQHIRKKFAKDLAEREYYKSKGYTNLKNQEGTMGNKIFSSIHQAPTYTINDLAPYIQECLKPLETAALVSKRVKEIPMEDKLTRNDDGTLATEVLTDKVSLVEKAKKG